MALGIQVPDSVRYGDTYRQYEEMEKKLKTAIHQFAKRQMTWFRGMERRGFTIHWMDAGLPMEEKIAFVQAKLEGN